MKTATFLFASLLLVNALTLQSSQHSPELNEASALTDSVMKLLIEGKYDEALPLAKRALEIKERLLPRTDPRIATSLGHLGDIYIVKRDYDDAKKIFEQLLQIQAERSSPDDVSLAPIMERLAIVYHRQGAKAKAVEMFERELASVEKAFGPESSRVAQSLFTQGEFYRLEKDSERAAASYRRSLLIYGKVSGIHAPEFERASEGYTCLGYQNKKLDVAKDLMEIQKQFAPPQTPDELLGSRVLNGMALSLPKPEYSEAARARNLSGTVIVKVEIDETGSVISAKDICQGPPYLSESSVASALNARFTPTKVSGKPVKVKGIIQYRFVRM